MIKSFGITDKGKKRDKNEDSILINDKIGLYIVADGMGGHEKGDVASRTVVQTLNKFVQKKFMTERSGQDDFYTDLLQEAVSAASSEIVDYSRKLPLGSIMGTTVSAGLLKNDKLYTAHVGDSRIYRVRNGNIEKLTRDHNQAQDLIDMGHLKEEDADTHRSSHILTRAVGSSGSVEPDIQVHNIEDGDLYLISSDGLFRVMKVDDVKDILVTGNNPEDKCRTLVDKTLEGGAPDNVSVIIVETEKKSILGRIFS